jgi:dTDP-4-dehydrorhamnose reductase
MKSPVWITGAGGFIGNYLVQTAPKFAPGCRVVGLTRGQLDLTDFAAVRREFQQQRPQLVVHCAAMSWPPACQENPQLARRVNLEVTKNLAGLAAEIPFVFLSTDLVYDGQKGNYVETDPVNPLSVYGETKVAAENILRGHPQCLILRCAINAGRSPAGNHSFNEQLRQAWQRGEMFRLFTDEFRCPIPAAVTARAVWELVAKNVTGTFHLGGAEKLSRYEIGKLLAARWPDMNPQLVPASRKEYQGAPRTPDVSLNCAKVQKLLSFPLPRFSEWLAANPNEPI